MKIHDLIQGTPEWEAHRLNYRNASDAPVMMGLSPYKTREQLIHEVAAGHPEEITPEMEALFARGHQHEAWARPYAEDEIGEALYPVTGSEGNLSCSFDGLTMDGRINWEHKMLNKMLRAAMFDGCTGADLPELYRVQMEQQHTVSAAEKTLFSASSFDKTGKLIEIRHCWYTPDPELAQCIVLGWAQFDADVEAYKAKLQAEGVAPAAAVVEAKQLKQLPALVIKVDGKVMVQGNLEAYKEAATEFLAGIKETLESDQDFVDADTAAKFCGDGEERLQLAKQQVIAQTGTVEDIVNTIDYVHGLLRSKRLLLEKLVKTRKTEIRGEIIAKAQADMDAHWSATCERLGESWIRRVCPDFAEAMKGKRNFDSCRTAVNQVLLQARLDMSALADRLQANRKALVVDGKDWFHLFADFSAVGTKPAEDFQAIATLRIQQNVAAEKAAQDKLDADRKQRISTRINALHEALTIYASRPAVEIAAAKISIESNVPSEDLYGDRLGEAVKLREQVLGALKQQYDAAVELERLAQAPAPDPAPAPAPVSAGYSVRPAARRTDVAENPTLTIGAINDRIGIFTMTERNLAELGFNASTVRGAKLFFESDYRKILRAVSDRMLQLASKPSLEPAL